MESHIKRPILVWLIFLWFGFVHLTSAYMALRASNIELPPGLEFQADARFYLLTFANQIFLMLAATLMFLRVSAIRWLFSFMLCMSILGFILTALTVDTSGEQYLSMLIRFGTYTFTTVYSFMLLKSGYSRSTPNKALSHVDSNGAI